MHSNALNRKVHKAQKLPKAKHFRKMGWGFGWPASSAHAGTFLRVSNSILLK